MDKQKVGAIAGLGLVAAIGYYLYASTQTEVTTIGGSGSFTGLGGSEGLLTGGNAALAGTSDSGINYNIALPAVDTSGIANLLSAPISGAPDEQLMPKKATLASEFIPTTLTSEEAKRLAESSQAAAAIAEGGYGKTLFSPIKSSSSVINLPSSSQLNEITSKKEASAQAAAAIAESGYGKTLFSPVATPNTSVSSSKKAATTTYKEGGQTKYKDASGKVHIVVKSKK